MRRALVVAVMLLGTVAPAAGASSVSTSVARVSSTQAYLVMDGWVADVGGQTAFEIGTTTSYGTTIPWLSTGGPGSSGGASAIVDNGLVPGTLYHMRGVLTEGPTVTHGPDRVFTTPLRGGLVLSVPFETFAGATTLAGTPPEFGPFETCKDTFGPSAGFDAQTVFKRYTVHNPSVRPGCATVVLTTACTTVRVGVYATGAFSGSTYGGAFAASSSFTLVPSEFEFPMAAGGTYTVVVSDNGSCATYALQVYSSAVVPPRAATSTAAVVGVRSATLRGSAGARFVQGTATHFEWGRTTAYGNVLEAGAVPADGASHPVALRLRDLAPNVVYHARLVVSGAGGRVFGADTTFRTRRRQAPLRLASSLLGVSTAGRATARVRCPLTTVRCRAKIVLKRTTGRRATVASAAFSIAGGATARVHLRLSTANRRLVRRVGNVRVTATLTGRDGDAVSFPTTRKGARLIWNG